MKETLAPCCVRWRLGAQARRDKCLVLRVRIINSEYGPSPPRVPVRWNGGKIDEGRACLKARERCVRAAIYQPETKVLVERDRTDHIADRQRYGTNTLDSHSLSSIATPLPCIGALSEYQAGQNPTCVRPCRSSDGGLGRWCAPPTRGALTGCPACTYAHRVANCNRTNDLPGNSERTPRR